MPAPLPDDEYAYVWVQHDSEEGELVELVSERLDEADALTARFEGEQMFVRHRGAEHLIPLAISPHDRYILISSLAFLLKDKYRFFQHVDYLGESANALFIARASELGPWTPKHLTPLDLGNDYFAGEDFKVPYLGNLNNNPNFEADRASAREQRQQAGEAIDEWLDDQLKTDPELRKSLDDVRRLTRPWWKFWG